MLWITDVQRHPCCSVTPQYVPVRNKWIKTCKALIMMPGISNALSSSCYCPFSSALKSVQSRPLSYVSGTSFIKKKLKSNCVYQKILFTHLNSPGSSDSMIKYMPCKPGPSIYLFFVMLIEYLFVISPNWKQTKCQSTLKGIDNGIFIKQKNYCNEKE